MISYNILLLSVGRRVELVNCFRNAARQLNIESKIIGGDCSDMAPALYFADEMCILPRIDSADYIGSIIDCCNEYDIALIVPTIDTDLLLLAENGEYIEKNTDAKLLISDLNVIEICRDKEKTQTFLKNHSFKAPYTYTEKELDNPSDLTFPLFIKPKDGSSSINAFRVHDADELHVYRKLIKNPIVQDLLEGEEYTVDCFLDFAGNIVTIVPRLRMATRGGEIYKGRIVKDPAIIDETKRVLEALKPIGQITAQCIKTKRGIEFIEINPRFGGGAPMSIASGADSCANLYRILMGQNLQYNEAYTDGLLFLRFDSSICLDQNMKIMGHDTCRMDGYDG